MHSDWKEKVDYFEAKIHLSKLKCYTSGIIVSAASMTACIVGWPISA